MTPLIFGSEEANEILARTTGKRFDLREADPFVPQERDHPDAQDDHEPSCTVCGSYMEWEDCWNCGGKGGRDGEDLMEEDPMWYSEDDWETCDICRGKGGYFVCASLPHADEPESEATP